LKKGSGLSTDQVAAALVAAAGTDGMTEESATLRFWMLCTRSSGSTTAMLSVPIRQVPVGWPKLDDASCANSSRHHLALADIVDLIQQPFAPFVILIDHGSMLRKQRAIRVARSALRSGLASIRN
jgi:hypothetical protein